MTNKFKKRLINDTILTIIATVITFLSICALSWIATCGIIKLITLCFGWTFKWSIATGIWLMIWIAKSIFSNHTTVKK